MKDSDLGLVHLSLRDEHNSSFIYLAVTWWGRSTSDLLKRRVMSRRRLPAPSGRPFNAHFEDIAAAAGLRSLVVCCGVDGKKYIREANGCGCAFIDHDNDGWVDIFLLSGTRLEEYPPDATNRLYKTTVTLHSRTLPIKQA